MGITISVKVGGAKVPAPLLWFRPMPYKTLSLVVVKRKSKIILRPEVICIWCSTVPRFLSTFEAAAGRS